MLCLFLATACRKDNDSNIVAEQNQYDIGSENSADRQFIYSYKGYSAKYSLEAELSDTLKGAYRGWSFNLYDKESDQILSTLTVYRNRYKETQKSVFDDGIFYTNSLLLNTDTFLAIVEIDLYKKGSLKKYRAIKKIPDNFIKIENSIDFTTLTFTAEMNTNSFGPDAVILANGRFRIRKK